MNNDGLADQYCILTATDFSSPTHSQVKYKTMCLTSLLRPGR